MPEDALPRSCTAFVGDRHFASGSYAHVARRLSEDAAELGHATVLVFDDASGQQMDFDLRGAADEVEARYAEAGAGDGPPATDGRGEPRGPGRPKLGVVSKEVTLLPRHWAWLGAQRGGASATLRRLVDQARQVGESAERTRGAQDATYRFASAMAGNLGGFEEAMRALYAGDAETFMAETEGWPDDIRGHARALAEPALSRSAGPQPGSDG